MKLYLKTKPSVENKTFNMRYSTPYVFIRSKLTGYKTIDDKGDSIHFRNPSLLFTKILWKKDVEGDTIEGFVEKDFLFDIEIKENTQNVTLYQMKKPIGNMIDFPSLEAAQDYCDKILPAIPD